MDDLYCDDNYDDDISFNAWLRRKYTCSYKYEGVSEHFMEAKHTVKDFIAETPNIRAMPSFSEWMDMTEADMAKIKKCPKTKNIEDTSCEEMQRYFADMGGLDELLERLKLTEILGKKANANELAALLKEAEKSFEESKDACLYYTGRLSKPEKLL